MPREPSVSERIPTPRSSGTVAVSERRMFPRLGIAMDVSLGTESHFFTACATNLSRGGVFVITYRALALGSELSVEFDLPAGRVTVRGVVRWERGSCSGASPGYGIRFAGLSHFDERLIESFCASRLGASESPQALAG